MNETIEAIMNRAIIPIIINQFNLIEYSGFLSEFFFADFAIKRIRIIESVPEIIPEAFNTFVNEANLNQ